MKKWIFIFWMFLALCLQAQDTIQQVIPGRTNSPEQVDKPYVILISADGFRYNFADEFDAENLKRLRTSGVAAHSMIPSFPSLTFPNHYTLATGLYPAHHGIVNNYFYDENKAGLYRMSNRGNVRDSSWYGGTPIWVLAEEHHMVSANFFWVGSEAPIKGIYPTYFYYYTDKIPIDRRIEVVKQWLTLPKEKRPHLICFYLPEVDHAAHQFGPDAPETGEAVKFVDEAIGKMTAMTDSLSLPVNYIFVSDHGMTQVDTIHSIQLPKDLDTSRFIIPVSDALLQLYAKNKADVLPTYTKLKAEAKDFDVYLTTDMPAQWHYSKSDDRYNRLGDIILIPHLPLVFNIAGRRVSPGKHGFDPALMDMRATFYAWGPAFKSGKEISDFENIHVYPLIAQLLGLTYTEEIDGKLEVLRRILK